MKKLILITALIASTCLATLSPTYAPAQYDCNGSVVNFTVSWQFFAKTDLQVYIVDSDGVSTLLTEGAGVGKYTVYAPNSDYSSGARITTGSTYASGNRISISRVVPDGQELSINGDFIPAKPLEQQLDKLAAQNQQTANSIGLTLSFPDTDPAGLTNTLPVAENRASKIIQFDASGNVAAVSPIESGTVFVDDVTIQSVTNLISVKALGIGTAQLAIDAVTTTNILDGDVTTAKIDDEAITLAKIADDAVTLAKMADLGDYTVLGNVSGASTNPAEVVIIDDDSMATAADDNLASAESIKAYVDTEAPTYAMQYSGVTFTGSMPTSYTNLDLSGTIGSNRCFVHLSVETDASASIEFRPKGEAKTQNPFDWCGGTARVRVNSGYIGYVSLITDVSGVIQWDSTTAGSGGTVVTLLAYQVLQ